MTIYTNFGNKQPVEIKQVFENSQVEIKYLDIPGRRIVNTGTDLIADGGPEEIAGMINSLKRTEEILDNAITNYTRPVNAPTIIQVERDEDTYRANEKKEIVTEREAYGRIKLVYFRNGFYSGYTELANEDPAIKELRNRLALGWLLKFDHAKIVSPVSTYTGPKKRNKKQKPYWTTYANPELYESGE